MELVISSLYGILASLIIARACDGFEAAADYLGRNMSDGLKGSTINAIGSSFPEFFVTVIYLFWYHNTTGFAGGIGTTAGSAVFNALVIPAAVILVVLVKNPDTFLHVSKNVVLRDGLALIAAELVLIYLLGDKLTYAHGLILMLIYVIYAAGSIIKNRTKLRAEDYIKPTTDAAKSSLSVSERTIAFLKLDLESACLQTCEITTWEAWKLLAVSTGVIAAACWLLVDACEMFGHSLQLHGYFIAVIIAAAASSVPDAILSIKDANKGNYDDALSNALGSNMFDICFALGAPLFVYTLFNGPILIPADTAQHVIELRVLLLILTIIAFFIFILPKQFTRTHAYVLISGYVGFVMFIIIRAYELPCASCLTSILHFIYRVLMPGI